MRGVRCRQPERERAGQLSPHASGPDPLAGLTLRLAGRLHHIGIGRTQPATHVLLLVHDLPVRIIDAATGEPLRELTIDPTRDYQPTGRPPGPAPKKH